MRKLAKTHQRPILSHPEASDISGCPSQQRRREVTCACSSSCVIGRVQLKLQLAIEEHTIRRAAYLFNLKQGEAAVADGPTSRNRTTARIPQQESRRLKSAVSLMCNSHRTIAIMGRLLPHQFAIT